MALKGNKTTTQFGAPVVAPGVPAAALPPQNAVALKYQQEALARRQSMSPPLQKYTTPVGGGPAPPIPRLDQQPQGTGMTMADVAMQQSLQNMSYEQRMALMGAQSGQPQQPPLVQPQQAQPPGNPFLAMQQGLLPNDILPEAAKQDPAFQQGMGSMAAQAQPMLAFKYGVIRNGRHLAPQELSTGRRGGLSPKSVQDLQALQNLQRGAPSDPGVAKHMDSAERQAEADAAAGPAGAAARLANAPGDADIKPISAEERAELSKRKALDGMDELDWKRLREAMIKDLLNNDEQREIIEGRLEPMDVTDLIMRGRVSQIVTIIPNGKLEYEFQSTTGQEDLAVKRLAIKEARALDVSDAYITDKFAMMSACLGLTRVNSLPLPSHLDDDGNFNENKFWEKFNFFIRQGFHMIASVGINFFWFDVRVRKLFVAEKVRFG